MWFDELQDINQMLEAHNVGLKTLLLVAEEENQRLQENLQAMKMQIGEGSMTETVIIPFCDHGSFTNYQCKHESENGCTLLLENEDYLHVARNQGGFLEASSSDPPHQEQLDTSQKVDQES